MRGWDRGHASGSRPAPDPPARDAGPRWRPRRSRRQRRSRGPGRRPDSRRPRRAARSPRRGPSPGRVRVSPACPDPRERCRGRPSRAPGPAGPRPAAARRSSPRSSRRPAAPPLRLVLLRPGSRARLHPDRRFALRRLPGDRTPPRPAPACTRRSSSGRPASRAGHRRRRSPTPFACLRSSPRSSASLTVPNSCSCARQTTRRRPRACQCTVPEPVSRKEAAPSSCVVPVLAPLDSNSAPRSPGVPGRRGIQRLAAVVRPRMDACPVGKQHFDRGHGDARRRPVQAVRGPRRSDVQRGRACPEAPAEPVLAAAAQRAQQPRAEQHAVGP